MMSPSLLTLASKCPLSLEFFAIDVLAKYSREQLADLVHCAARSASGVVAKRANGRPKQFAEQFLTPDSSPVSYQVS